MNNAVAQVVNEFKNEEYPLGKEEIICPLCDTHFIPHKHKIEPVYSYGDPFSPNLPTSVKDEEYNYGWVYVPEGSSRKWWLRLFSYTTKYYICYNCYTKLRAAMVVIRPLMFDKRINNSEERVAIMKELMGDWHGLCGNIITRYK